MKPKSDDGATDEGDARSHHELDECEETSENEKDLAEAQGEFWQASFTTVC